MFTGQQVNFGNYSCLTKKDVIALSQQESLWSSFSGTVKKSILRLNTINSITNKKINVSPQPRRRGDSECLVANNNKIIKKLKWKPKFNSLKKIIYDSLLWEKKKLNTNK